MLVDPEAEQTYAGVEVTLGDRYSGDLTQNVQIPDEGGFAVTFELPLSKLNAGSAAKSQVPNTEIHSVKVTPRLIEGNLITWSAWQKYKPNVPVVGYLEIEYSDDRRKTLQLELGQVGDELKFVNYIPDGDRKPPETLNPGPSITGHIEPLANGTHLVTDTITNPGSLLLTHLANEEIRLRDFRK